MENEQGDSRISILLTEVTDQQTKDFSEAICDLLADYGFAAVSDEDEVRSLVLIEGWPWPLDGDVAAFIEEQQRNGASFMIPMAS